MDVTLHLTQDQSALIVGILEETITAETEQVVALPVQSMLQYFKEAMAAAITRNV